MIKRTRESMGRFTDAARRLLLGHGVVHVANKPNEEYRPEIEGELSDDFCLAIKDLKNQLGISDGARVVYPGSNTDARVALVFGKEHVIHVDPDKSAMVAMSEAGFEIATSRVEDYMPDKPFDVMVAINSYGVPTQQIVDLLVAEGGYIIANNYTGWAHDLNDLPGVELAGAIMPSYNGWGGQDEDSPRYVGASELPVDVTDIRLVTYEIINHTDGRVDLRILSQGDTAEEGVMCYTNAQPNYPDALFVFQRSTVK